LRRKEEGTHQGKETRPSEREESSLPKATRGLISYSKREGEPSIKKSEPAKDP